MRRLRRLVPLAVSALAIVLVPRPAAAQFIPYFGKNKVKYDNFAWRVYKSPHFEVFYYPEFEQHLARLSSYLESGYLKISTGLKHEMPEPIPVIFYKTHSEFEQTNLYPAFIPEGVEAFTEPVKNRMVIPIDEPPDRMQGLITHEMIARLRVRPHPARHRLRPRPAGDPAVGRRGARRLLPWRVGPARPDDDPRRGPHRQGAAPVAGRVRGLLRPARLQHGPRVLRVHGGALRQGGHPPVPLHAAQGHPRRRAGGALQAGLPHDPAGVRRRRSTSG